MFKTLSLTILVCVFFLIGLIIPKFVKDKNKLIQLSTGVAFLIILYLIIFDLFPEILSIYKPFNIQYLLLMLIFILIGIFILKILDFFVPEHTHNHAENEVNIEEHNNHFFHIGLITSITLIIHNILEGISIYITGTNNFKAGLLMAFTVGLHNLPLGIEISAYMNAIDKKTKFTRIIFILLAISSFIGAFLLYLLNIQFAEFYEGIFLSITLGMLLYIGIFELLPEIKVYRKDKNMQIGLIIGIIIAIIITLL